jgi:exopolysaccharide biosynthesis operon protein EpsL
VPQPGGAIASATGTQAAAVRDSGEPAFQLRALAGFERENNVFRVPSSGAKTSDQVFIAGIGFKADRRYGLQRFRADVEADTFRYDKNSELNYSTLNYGLAWDWSFTPRLHGVLSADRRQFREITTDPVSAANIVGRRTERSEVAEGIYELGAAWRLLAGATHTQSTSTQPATWDASPSVTSARVGVGYELASGTSLYGRYRRGDGKYANVPAGAASGDFKEDETEVQLRWPITAKTSVDARIGHLSRDHDASPQRDFSGVVGSLAAIWDVTGKTRIMGGYNRDLSASGLAAGGHVVSNRFFIGPIWKATAQISVNARYDRVSRDWKDVPGGSPEVGRNESVQLLSAGVDWEPRRWLTVSGYVRGERQKSNLNTGYRNTTVGAMVKGYF